VTSLRSLADIRQFFHTNRTPIYFFHSAPSTLFGADSWISGLKFVSSIDAFDGEHANDFVPHGGNTRCFSTTEAANNHLLSHPEVIAWLRRSKANGKALFLMFDRKTEALARNLGLEICLPAANLRRRLDSKVIATRLAEAAGVRAVPNVLAKIDSYHALRRLSLHLGEDLVIQLPHGDAGKTTFFISTAADFQQHAQQITRAPAVKVMTRIRCRQATIEGCVTTHGTLVGPLLGELAGIEQLTPYRGGWCGNELYGTDAASLSRELRCQAQRATLAIGAQLKKEGYRGNFGIDFLIHQDTNELYFGELNPRLTGVTLLTSQAALDKQEPPLLLFHLLEWLRVNYSVDVEEFNRRSSTVEHASTWSSLVVYHIRNSVETLTTAPKGGIWRMNAHETIHFSRRAFQLQALNGEHEAILFRTINIGQKVFQGTSYGRLLTRGRITSDDGRLNRRAMAWLAGFRAHFGTRSVALRVPSALS
jgi:hypothetical protein